MILLTQLNSNNLHLLDELLSSTTIFGERTIRPISLENANLKNLIYLNNPLAYYLILNSKTVGFINVVNNPYYPSLLLNYCFFTHEISLEEVLQLVLNHLSFLKINSLIFLCGDINIKSNLLKFKILEKIDKANISKYEIFNDLILNKRQVEKDKYIVECYF